ncbi:uncharacterized protein LOC129572655 [Sitodiplosis mosellana]|uniref:uncharacterized protein LOC129572655 n=1 Tax=Sitodiplosis mosellana TaxID=263140 RepID=UPI002443C27B|nr:uncharacterized protein LOC129572655 [Sitodiplosis mosellana]
MDGTFSVVPVIFKQLYTIHGRYKGHHVPLVYVLTSDKKEETYNAILRALLDIEPKINPTDFMTDFEKGAMNAVQRNFPMAEVHGCFFHFTQNIWRHIQLVGLQTVYNDNADFAFQFRLIIALAFLPTDCVSDAYDELITTEFFNGPNVHKDAIEELLTYFQSTYVYDFDRFGKKKPPLFPPALWNVYGLILSGFPRTNNHCEGWHNRIAAMWGTHPSIFTFINGMKQEQDMQELEMARIEAGNEAAARRKTYVQSDKRIIELVKQFDADIHDGSYLPYLKSIAHNARF